MTLAIGTDPVAYCVNMVTNCAENLWAAKGIPADEATLIVIGAADVVDADTFAPGNAGACPEVVDCATPVTPPMIGEPVADAL